jgi:glycosyltransferase involved in cell wall biosynthesis
MIEALRRDYRVSLLTWKSPDLDAVNQFFGTTLRPSDVEVLVVSPWLRRLARHTPTPAALLKSGHLLCLGRKLAPGYDVLITADNEADLGRKGIQYVHFPTLDPRRPVIDLHWYHGSARLVDLYRKWALRITGFSIERMRRNVTLVNSDWTGSRIREIHGIEPRTVYPPAVGGFNPVPWEARENGFVCIGRLSPEKELEKIIEIVSRVRAHGNDAHLHIIGTPEDAEYYRRLQRKAEANASWVRIESGLSREEVIRRIATHRYGLHGMQEEPFGMSVAEMARGGCIVFVPEGGGQVEVVGAEDQLRYRSPSDAAQKIAAVMADSARGDTLRAHLAARASRFSAERFVSEIQDAVAELCADLPRTGKPH